MSYSVDFRRQALRTLSKNGFSYRKTAVFYGISPDCLVRWKRQLEPKLSDPREPRKISNATLRADVRNHPDDFAYERASRLGVSKSGISDAMRRLGLSRKKNTQASARRPKTT